MNDNNYCDLLDILDTKKPKVGSSHNFNFKNVVNKRVLWVFAKIQNSTAHYKL